MRVEYAKRAAMKLYRAYGLTIQSTLDIPGAIAIAGDAGPVDIVVTEGPVAVGSNWSGLTELSDDGRVMFEARGAARFLCEADAVTLDRIAGANDRKIGGFLIATALPAVLWMRGEIVLHAAAVMLPGTAGALAIMGAQWSGKSTVLRSLIAMGARIVADDTVCVRRAAAGIEASGLSGGYFLGKPPRAYHAVEGGIDTAPLTGIMLLTPRTGDEPDIRKLPPIEALTGLIAHRHRPRIPALLGRTGGRAAGVRMAAARRRNHADRRRNRAVGEICAGDLVALVRRSSSTAADAPCGFFAGAA